MHCDKSSLTKIGSNLWRTIQNLGTKIFIHETHRVSLYFICITGIQECSSHFTALCWHIIPKEFLFSKMYLYDWTTVFIVVLSIEMKHTMLRSNWQCLITIPMLIEISPQTKREKQCTIGATESRLRIGTQHHVNRKRNTPTSPRWWRK